MICSVRCKHFLLSLVLALSLAAAGCLSYRKRSFQGPATVTDTGVFSYYRYHFLFSPKLDARQNGDRTYRFHGLPSARVTIFLAVVPFNPADRKLLKSLTTVVTTDLKDDKGSLVCSASGPLSESIHGTSLRNEHGTWTDTHWVLGDGAFWSPSCTDIKVKHSRSYVLTVKLDRTDPQTPTVTLEPRIEGGGNEVP